MKLVIDISDNIDFDDTIRRLEHHIEGRKDVRGDCSLDIALKNACTTIKSVLNGTSLPEHHGDLIDKGDVLHDLDCDEEMRLGKNVEWVREVIRNAPTIIEATNNNNDYTWAKELIKRTGLSIAPEDGSKPYGYDLEDKVWRSDVIDLLGHGSTYTSEEAQKMIKNLPSAEEVEE